MKNWNIIPIKKGEKIAKIKWKEYLEQKYPKEKLNGWNGNYGVICGETSNNLVIFDFDYHNKKSFGEIMTEIEKEFPGLTKTYIEETPNGYHLFFYIKGEIIPKRHYYKNSEKKEILTKFRRKSITKFSEILKGIDILGQGGYSLIYPSEVNNGKYKKINNSTIKEITYNEYEKLIEFLLLDEPEQMSMRKPFIDILRGKIDIEEESRRTRKSEHVYWKYLYLEAYNFLKLQPEELFKVLEENQSGFDIKTTIAQLDYINFDEKPMTNTTLWEYFPDYKKEKKKGITEKKEYIKIAEALRDKYTLITMKDSNELMIKNGNIYTKNIEKFYEDLASKIREANKNYTYVRSNVIRYLKDITKFNPDNFCYEKWVVNFKNGYYNATDNKFYPSQSYTDKTFFYEMPHLFKRDKEYDCPKFKKCLDDWLPETSKITKKDIFEMMGYTMTMNTNLKMAFFIFGEKNTGKTTFQNILEYIIGNENRVGISLQRISKNQFGTHGLQFKILNMVGDMGGTKITDTSTFKLLTGGDTRVSAEIKNGPKYQFINTTKIWYNSNEIPEIEKDDNAFYGRWVLIPFPNVFPLESKTTISNLSDLICDDNDEIQGIIHECVKGMRRLYVRGYFRTEILKNSKHVWRYNADPLYAFLHDKCIKDKDEYVVIKDFKSKFNKFLYNNNKKPIKNYELTNQLERYNVFKDRLNTGNRDYIYCGIKWKKMLTW